MAKKYDVVLSFAGEDRFVAEGINYVLKKYGVRTFFDNDHQAELWGKNLGERLNEIYRDDGTFCVMLISKSYLGKIWTKHERRAALSRMMRQEEEYILPVLLDETKLSDLPGFTENIGYVHIEKCSTMTIGQLICEKLKLRGALDFDTLFGPEFAFEMLKYIHSSLPIAHASYHAAYVAHPPIFRSSLR